MSIGIEMVGSESCVPCKEAMRILKSKGIEYSYYQIGKTNERLSELLDVLRAKGVRTVPAFFKDGEYIGSGLTALPV